MAVYIGRQLGSLAVLCNQLYICLNIFFCVIFEAASGEVSESCDNRGFGEMGKRQD